MAERRPIVLVDGELQELPVGDTLPGGGGSGAAIISGTINPTTEGADGEFYINTVTWTIFGPKTAGVWPSGVSMIGPSGSDGAPGTNGQGVPTGGTSEQVLAKVNGTDFNTYWKTLPAPGASSQNWAVPHRGAVVTMVAKTLNLNSGQILSWDTEVYDTDNFWDGASPTLFTIPAGVTKVRIHCGLFLDSNAISSSTAYIVARKNGSTYYPGAPRVGVEPGYNNQISSLHSGVIDVTAGDTIDILSQFGDSTIPVVNGSYFQIEVVEATDQASFLKPHHFFISGLPAANSIVYQAVLTETCYLKTTSPTEGYANTTATAAADFDIQKNGVSVGTISFAIGSNTCTVTIGSDVTFVKGDRLSVVSPVTQDATLADVALAVALELG